MNKRDKILGTIIIAGLFLIGVALFSSQKKEESPPNQQEEIQKDARTASITSKEALTASSSVDAQTKNELQDSCKFITSPQSPYATIEKLKANEKIIPRFENAHVRIDGKIFRLRHFFKEGSENEREKFLVLEEDAEETARLKESQDHKPGPLYKKLSQAQGEILYREEGVLTERGVFVHFINGKIQSLQGSIEGKNLDCVLNP